MTAVNVIRKRDSIIILTDGAGYDAAGFVRAPMTKVMTIPHLRAAVMTRGGSQFLPWAAGVAARYMTFDDLIEHGADRLEEEYDKVSAAFADAPESQFQVIVAGWSETRGAETYGLTSFYEPRQGWQPWEFNPMGADAISPDPEPEHLLNSGLGDITSVEQFDAVKHGLGLLEAQRATRYPPRAIDKFRPDSEAFHLIGVNALLTTITRDGITQRVLKRWDDKMGERIEVEASSQPGLNRHERRAAKKRAA